MFCKGDPNHTEFQLLTARIRGRAMRGPPDTPEGCPPHPYEVNLDGELRDWPGILTCALHWRPSRVSLGIGAQSCGGPLWLMPPPLRGPPQPFLVGPYCSLG